jgi:hypothetical protein
MLQLKKLHKYFLGILTSITLLILSLAILGISLFSANRQQAGEINLLTVPELVLPDQN